MLQATGHACSACGHANPEEALVCGLCGEVLRRVRTARAMPSSIEPALPRERDREAAPGSAQRTHQRELRTGAWPYLAIGAVTAPIFALTPMLKYMGWFLASLVHEMGHSAMAWLFGMPAFPAISLAGHAAAMHSEQSLLLALAIAAAIGAAAWHFLGGRPRRIALALLAVLYPLCAFTGVKELLHLCAGHGGELAFATLCLWKTLDGGFTHSRLERALYGTVGWYLLGKNVILCFGLMTSASSRAWYADTGSFGMTNDLIRVAEDVLGWSLPAVAFLVLVVALAVLPAALALWRLSSGHRA